MAIVLMGQRIHGGSQQTLAYQRHGVSLEWDLPHGPPPYSGLARTDVFTKRHGLGVPGAEGVC